MSFDVSIDGVQYRLLRGADENNPTGFRVTTNRAQLLQQDIAEIGTPAFASRTDTRPFYQTSWAGGSRWERPLVTQDTATTYETSRGFDTYMKSGALRVLNAVTRTTDTNLMNQVPRISEGADGLYAIGVTQIDATPNRDVYKWDAATNAFVRVTGSNIGGNLTTIHGLGFNQGDGFFYLASNQDITRFDPVGGTEGSVLSALTQVIPGTNIFAQDGRVVYYNGNILQQVVDPGGSPSLTTIADDGMGGDWLGDLGATASFIRPVEPTLAIGTSDGIFYVKNVIQSGQPQAWVFRVDRDSTGTNISTPVATLPLGVVAFNIAWHLGSLVIAATSDWRALQINNSANAPFPVTQIWHVTGQNVGLVGIPLGESPDEFVSGLLGSTGPYLFMAGHKRIWVYDAIQGGIHPIHEDASADLPGFNSMSTVMDSNDNETFFFYGQQDFLTVNHTDVNAATTVAGFDTDTTTYRLESNYFDFGLPLESKTLTKVILNGDNLSANEQYALEISVDDGAFTQRATLTNGSYSVTDVASLNLTGRRFRYAIVFETTAAASKSDFRGLRLEATSGEAFRVWDLVLDGSEFGNVENEPVDPDDVQNNLETLALQEDHVPFISNYDEFDQAAAAAVQTKVQRLSIDKGDPAESVIRVQLVEAA